MFWLGIPALMGGLAGCGGGVDLPPASERTALVQALERLPEDPAAALELCDPMRSSARDECVLAAVEADPSHSGLEDWCDSLPEGTSRSECWFQLAEGRGDLAACTRAGPFMADCRLHVWTQQLPDLWRDRPELSEGVSRCRQAMEEQGLDPQDDRFWAATFRQAMARPPLDRRACKSLEPRLAEACWNTGVAVLHDRINRVRDFYRADCDRGLPADLAIVTPDPELEALRDSRWRAEICPPQAPDPDSESMALEP